MAITETSPTGVALARRIRVGEVLYAEILDFLIEESNLLDQDLLDEWLTLLAEDISYRMPVRDTLTRGSGDEFDPVMAHLDEDIGSLKLRIRRVLHTGSAYAENPPSRVRRSITNVRVHETPNDGEYAVTSHLLVLRNRWDLPTYDVMSCVRDDLLRRADDSFLIARRRILVDQATIGMPNIAILL